jgi:uncharacterized protein with NRDE domain
MCLLVVLSRVVPGVPLVVGGNRDERLDRPAEPMTVLREEPWTLGGRDLKAGGTWLAVNDAGVVAGLTNRPREGGPDATKRSRGELPLALTDQPTAALAVKALVEAYDPGDYNSAWLLVGDRVSLFAVELGGEGAIVVTELPPGVHVLENRALGAESGKVDHVRSLLSGIERLAAPEVVERLGVVLADHEIPVEEWPEEPVPDPPAATGAEEGVGEASDHVDETSAEKPKRLPEVRAACVHTEEFGTRWSGIVTVPADPEVKPVVRYTEGPPCTNPYLVAALWP